MGLGCSCRRAHQAVVEMLSRPAATLVSHIHVVLTEKAYVSFRLRVPPLLPLCRDFKGRRPRTTCKGIPADLCCRAEKQNWHPLPEDVSSGCSVFRVRPVGPPPYGRALPPKSCQGKRVREIRDICRTLVTTTSFCAVEEYAQMNRTPPRQCFCHKTSRIKHTFYRFPIAARGQHFRLRPPSERHKNVRTRGAGRNGKESL